MMMLFSVVNFIEPMKILQIFEWFTIDIIWEPSAYRCFHHKISIAPFSFALSISLSLSFSLPKRVDFHTCHRDIVVHAFDSTVKTHCIQFSVRCSLFAHHLACSAGVHWLRAYTTSGWKLKYMLKRQTSSALHLCVFV